MGGADQEQSRASGILSGYMENPSMAFGDITDAFTELLPPQLTPDKKLYVWHHLIADNKTNEDIVLRFDKGDSTAESEVIIPANSALIFDNYRFHGSVEIKYRTIAPTLKEFLAWVW